MAEWTRSKPVWDAWNRIPLASLTELLALSLDFDLHFHNNEGFSEELLSKWAIRALVVERHFGVSIPPPGLAALMTFPGMSIATFAKWALSVGFDIPPELEARAAEPGVAATVENPRENPDVPIVARDYTASGLGDPEVRVKGVDPDEAGRTAKLHAWVKAQRASNPRIPVQRLAEMARTAGIDKRAVSTLRKVITPMIPLKQRGAPGRPALVPRK